MGFLETLVTPRKKAATGVGVSMVQHGVPLSSTQDTPQRKARTALAAYRTNTYIRSAERAIVNRIAMVPWWLEDEQGERITQESPEEQRGVLETLQRPYTPMAGDPIVATPRTFEGLRALTIRHMGLVGYGFWYIVRLGDIPLEYLYINPTRLLPSQNDAGELIGWVLDPDMRGKGTPLSADEVVPFYLEEPEEGFLPDGLVTTALTKVELQRLGDTQMGQLLATGGRIPGMFAPKEGVMPQEVYDGLVRDFRNINEDPNAAKRTLVLKGPVDFTATAMQPDDAKTLDLMAMSGDDILSLWGVPRSQVGYQRPAGIGESVEDKDAEMMWKNAAGPRATTFYTTLQRLIDLTINLDWPEFDSDAPKYDMAQKSINVPMRGVERRAIVGLPPTGDPAIDDAIWLPINMVEVTQAPPFDPGDKVKARLEGSKPVQRLKDVLSTFLKDQAERIGRRIEDKASHVANKPKDDSVWWNQKREDEALLDVLRPHVTEFAQQGAMRASAKLHGKAITDDIFRDSLLGQTLRRLALRVTGINRTTRDRIAALILDGIDADLSPSEMGRSLRGIVKPLEGDTTGNELRRRLGDFGSELRAETIARTEMRVAQNGATIDAYQHEGVQNVEMLDGDGDAECAARDGRVVSLEEAESHMAAEHPNGTLDFAPVVNFEGKASPTGETAGVVPIVQHIHYPQPEFKVEMPPIPDIHIPPTEVHMPEVKVPDVEVYVPAPVVNVETPVNVAPAEAPTVNVAAPEVSVDVTPIAEAVKAKDVQPVYVTNMPPPRKARVRRDNQGRISEVIQED